MKAYDVFYHPARRVTKIFAVVQEHETSRFQNIECQFPVFFAYIAISGIFQDIWCICLKFV